MFVCYFRKLFVKFKGLSKIGVFAKGLIFQRDFLWHLDLNLAFKKIGHFRNLSAVLNFVVVGCITQLISPFC